RLLATFRHPKPHIPRVTLVARGFLFRPHPSRSSPASAEFLSKRCLNVHHMRNHIRNHVPTFEPKDLGSAVVSGLKQKHPRKKVLGCLAHIVLNYLAALVARWESP